MFGRKRGRPKKEDSERKTRCFKYYLTEDKYDRLKYLATSNGFRSVTVYLDKVMNDEAERNFLKILDNM